MQVQFNTDESVAGREALSRHAEEVVRHALDRFSREITRVEIHVSDNNGPKAGSNDKRCMMEARVAGLAPIVVRDVADSLHQAIDGAARKLRRSLDGALGKLGEIKRDRAGTTDDEDTQDSAT